MKTTKKDSIIQEFIWQPLVHVHPGTKAYIVQPGTTLPAQSLDAGWHWHWPLLSSIRVINVRPLNFTFNSKLTIHRQSFSDEAITAVSHDHQLFTVEGFLGLQINPKAPDAVLSKYNRHSTSRLIRPLVRQLIRLAFAQHQSNKLTPEKIISTIESEAPALLNPRGLNVTKIHISKMEQFKPVLK